MCGDYLETISIHRIGLRTVYVIHCADDGDFEEYFQIRRDSYEED